MARPKNQEKYEKLLDAIGIQIVPEEKGPGLRYQDKLGDDDVTPFIPDPGSFSTMATVKAGDWLDEHEEPGQTYKQFLEGNHRLPTGRKHTLYLLPVAIFEDPVPSEVLQPLAKYAETFFEMTVKVLEPRNMHGKVRVRFHQGVYQAHAGDIMEKICDIPNDGFCVAAITMCDLYPMDSWNFVFGIGEPSKGKGVYSLARYLSNFGDFYNTLIVIDSTSKDTIPSIIVRSCILVCHEIGEMFGLKTCIFYRCLMNGANHMEELDSMPCFMCPVCLRKLHHACRFDILKRYNEMAEFWTRMGHKKQSDWVRRRIQRLSSP